MKKANHTTGKNGCGEFSPTCSSAATVGLEQLTDFFTPQFVHRSDAENMATIILSKFDLVAKGASRAVPQEVPLPDHGPRTALHPYGQLLQPVTPGVTWEGHLAAEARDAEAD